MISQEDLIRREGLAHRTVRISYVDSKNNHSVREIEPYEIGPGYLMAYCTRRQDIRKFLFSGIQSVSATGISFVPRYPILL